MDGSAHLFGCSSALSSSAGLSILIRSFVSAHALCLGFFFVATAFPLVRFHQASLENQAATPFSGQLGGVLNPVWQPTGAIPVILGKSAQVARLARARG